MIRIAGFARIERRPADAAAQFGGDDGIGDANAKVGLQHVKAEIEQDRASILLAQRRIVRSDLGEDRAGGASRNRPRAGTARPGDSSRCRPMLSDANGRSRSMRQKADAAARRDHRQAGQIDGRVFVGDRG